MFKLPILISFLCYFKQHEGSEMFHQYIIIYIAYCIPCKNSFPKRNAIVSTLLLNKSLPLLGLPCDQFFSLFCRITLHYLLPNTLNLLTSRIFASKYLFGSCALFLLPIEASIFNYIPTSLVPLFHTLHIPYFSFW